MENVSTSEIFQKKGIKFCRTRIRNRRKLKNRTAIKNGYHLLEPKSLQWIQLVDALETPWKQSIRAQNTNLNSLRLYDHHLIKKNKFILLVNVIARNYITFSFYGIIKNQR